MSLTKHSWLPWCSRRKAMKEITELHQNAQMESARHERIRAAEKQRHLENEARFRDIIDRVQGYITPEGERVMIQTFSAKNDPKNLKEVGVRMEYEGDCLTFYTKVSKHFITRYGKVLTPSDIYFVAEYVGKRLATEIAQVMIAGKIEY